MLADAFISLSFLTFDKLYHLQDNSHFLHSIEINSNIFICWVYVIGHQNTQKFLFLFFNCRAIFHLISICTRWWTLNRLVICVLLFTQSNGLKLNCPFLYDFFSEILVFWKKNFNFFLFYLHKMQENNAHRKRQNHDGEWKKATAWVCTGCFYKSLFQTAVNPGLNVTCEYRQLFHPAAAALATTAPTVLCECAFLRTGLAELRQGGYVCISAVFALRSTACFSYCFIFGFVAVSRCGFEYRTNGDGWFAHFYSQSGSLWTYSINAPI